MPEPCAYSRCTARITNPDQAATLSLPGGDEKRFCSLTCGWSWLREHVEHKAAEVRTLPEPESGLRGLKKDVTWKLVSEPKASTPPPSSPPAKGRRGAVSKVTQPVKVYAPGEFKFDLVPDNTEIIAILENSITGQYRFVHHAFVPYVRVRPAHDDHTITIKASDRLRLAGEQAKMLSGRETMDLAVIFEGTGIILRDVLDLPLKVTHARTALDNVEKMQGPLPS